jgi:predicted MPP superfamily phosphohydrolase
VNAKVSQTLRIVVLSDLHYAPGDAAERGLEKADRLIRKLGPDLIVVSGDLSREGLVEQFAPVVDFLAGFGLENVRAIPGNRDFPATRASLPRPIDSDLHYFLTAPDTPELESEAPGVVPVWTPFTDFFDELDVFDDDRESDLALVGLNSEPDISAEALDRAVEFFDGSPATRRIFFTHRALLPVPTKRVKDGDLVATAGDVLARLLRARVALIICAHLHRVHTWQLGSSEHGAVVLSVPSLLDSSGGKVNGLVTVDLGQRSELRLVLHELDASPPRLLLETATPRRSKKHKRKAA